MKLRALAGLVLGAVVLTGCSVGKDAVVQGSDFQFVSPGGQVVITYPQAQRQALPDLAGDSLMQPGQQIKISDFPNKVLVVNIWGAWCGPCRTEAPELSSVYQQTKAQGVQLLGLDVRDERDHAQDFVRNNQIGYPSIFDPAARSLLALNGYPRNVIPSTIVLDRDHRVAAVYLEQVTASVLLPEIHSLAATG